MKKTIIKKKPEPKYEIWQKPYNEYGYYDPDNGFVFAPFAHSVRDIKSWDFRDLIENGEYEKLRQYHINNGYEYKTSSNKIKKYIEEFKTLKPGNRIKVPKRSVSKEELTRVSFLLEITSDPHFAIKYIPGKGVEFRGLVCNTKLISDNEQSKNLRNSLYLA